MADLIEKESGVYPILILFLAEKEVFGLVCGLGQGAEKVSTGHFSYTHPFESLLLSDAQADNIDSVSFGFKFHGKYETANNEMKPS